MSRVPSSRRRFSFHTALATWPVLLGLPVALVAVFSGSGPSSRGPGPMMCQVTRGPFVHEVSARGEVESAINVDVRCDVRSPQGWMTILEVVAEGTRVKRGDFLVRLDSSALETQLEQQKIHCEQSKATVAAVREKYEIAQKEETAYLEGEYRLARQQAEAGVGLAERKLKRAREYYEESRKLEVRGYVTARQLQADQFSVRAAETDLEVARLKLRLLDDYTKPTRLAQIQSTLVASKARLAAVAYTYELDQKQLADIREQIEKCIIRAPVDGCVVLAHLHHNDHSHMIEPGEKTYQRRALVRLPDPKHMQVVAKVEEDEIALVHPGLPVTICLEAFPGVALPGKVVRVAPYPEPEDWLSSNVKNYQTVVRIEEPMDGLRPRLTADVKIRVQQLDDQLQLPCQAVLEHGGKTYCLLTDGGHWKAQEVSVGPSNGRSVVIRAGLEEGQEVVLATAAHRHKVKLPKLPGESLASRSTP